MAKWSHRIVTRRRFLAASAAAIVAPTVIPTAALGAGNAVPPSGRVVMGFIGVGGMGAGNMRSFLGMDEVHVVAICDVDENMRDEAKKIVEDHYANKYKNGLYKGCDAYGDFRDLLARGDIDAVCIATPDHWHAIIAVEAARAGKDIYCEKPLSLTIREARAMVNAVRRYGRVLQTGSQQRSEYGGKFRQACEWVRSGRIGKVLTVHVGVGGPSGDCYLPAQPVPDGLDWDMWLGPAPWRPYNEELHPFSWRPYRDYSGSSMTDIGAHHFDIAQWGLNMDHTGPISITPPNGKDVRQLTYEYANGILMYHGGADGIKFTGADGWVEVNRDHLAAEPKAIMETPLAQDEVRLRQTKGHRADFIECVRSRERPICDVEIGCRSVTVCLLGCITYWLNRPLRWDPDREEFIGDAEANRWLDRPKRPPWRI
ncbi:MAG: Gfo/Idh/MocA family oxidoreductase [Planctomycetota bacterium]